MDGAGLGQPVADYGRGVEAVGGVEAAWSGVGYALAVDVVAVCGVGGLELACEESGVRGHTLILDE